MTSQLSSKEVCARTAALIGLDVPSGKLPAVTNVWSALGEGDARKFRFGSVVVVGVAGGEFTEAGFAAATLTVEDGNKLSPIMLTAVKTPTAEINPPVIKL